MPDFSVRSDTINVEQIMEQIRARILEKRGADYTEQEIRELAAVKLEKFLDPRGVRSDLLDQYRRQQQLRPAPPNYAFEDSTLFESHRAPLRWIRALLRPLLKLFFNPNPLVQALHIQSKVNTFHAERLVLDQLYFEVLHNAVVETTRLGIELKNLKMRVESLTGRLEFNERRARALESVVVYKPSEADVVVEDEPETPQTAERSAAASPGVMPETPGPGQRSRKRRRRRGRRGGSSATALMTSRPQETSGQTADAPEPEGDSLEQGERYSTISDGDEPAGEPEGDEAPGSENEPES